MMEADQENILKELNGTQVSKQEQDTIDLC